MENLALKIAIRLIIYPFIAYFIFSAIMFFLYTHPARYITRETPENFGLKYEEINLKTEDNIKINAWLLRNKKSKKALILCHGYPVDKGNILASTAFFAKDYNLLYLDFRAMGKSGGFLTSGGYNEIKDIKAAVHFLKNCGMEKIGLYGFSMGASAAIMAAAQMEDIRAVIADSPFDDLYSLMDSIFSNLGVFRKPLLWFMCLESKMLLGEWMSEISPVKCASKMKAPLFLIHGDRDSQIPMKNSLHIKKSKPDALLWIIKNADHGEAYFFAGKEYEKRTLDFLRTNL